MNLWDVARVCHDANRAYCQLFGDHSLQEWRELPDSQREAALAGVQFLHAHPAATDAEMHEAWRERRLQSCSGAHDPHLLEQTWKNWYRKVPLKEDPKMRPLAELPFQERVKYRLFRVICGALVWDDSRPGEDDKEG